MIRPYCIACKIALPDNANFCFRCSLPLAPFGISGTSVAAVTPPHSQIRFHPEDASKSIIESVPTELASKFQTAQGAITSERKLVSIVFADLSGFTALSEKLDPEKVTDLVNQYFKRIGQVVYQFEGYIDKFMGDCIMALFGAPIAHENDPELAISCALKMLEELRAFNAEMNLDLGMSIGINSGMVIAGGVGTQKKFEYTVMGDAVNIAQRLQSTAKRHQILVSKNIVKPCEQKFEFESLGPIRVKGKEAPIEVFSVLGPKQSQLKDRGIQSGYSKLIGREHELQMIKKLLDDAHQGRGQILLMSGEPGVGKSRLKHEMKKLAHASKVKWLEAKCSNLNRETPYFVFTNLLYELFEIDPRAELEIQNERASKISEFKLERTSEVLIRDLLKIPTPDAPLNLAPAQKKKATFVAIRNLLLQFVKDSPSVFYLEDLQFIDPISNELLSSILDSASGHPILIAGETRPDAPHTWNEKRNFTQMSLGPLNAEQSIKLVQAILGLDQIPQGLLKLIESKTDGNPLYVEEIVKSLIDSGKISKEQGRWKIAEDIQNVEVPHTVQGIISSRVDRLNDNDKLVLQYASIFGRKFSDTLLAKALGNDDFLYEALKQLRKRELIFEVASEFDEITYMFNHALVQEVTYQSILTKTRKILHQRVAQALEARFDDGTDQIADEYLEALAFHYQEAGIDSKSIQYRFRNAKRMAGSFNNAAAITNYIQAIEILEKTQEKIDQPSLFELYLLLTQVYILIADFESAEKFQWKVLELAKGKNDLVHIAKSYRWLGEISLSRGHFDKALDHFHISLEHSVKANDFDGQIRTYKGLANTWKRLNDFKKAVEMFEKGIEGAETLGSPKLMAEYLNDKATVLIELQQLEQAQKDLERSIDISHKDPACKPVLISSTLNLGVVQYFQKDIKGALLKFRETARMADQIGDLKNKLIARHNVGEMLSEFKEYDEALKEFQESYQIAKEMGNDLERVNNQLLIGHTQIKMGRASEGRALLESAIEEAKNRKFWNYYCNGLLCLADYYIDAEESTKAREIMETTLEKARELHNQSIINRCEEELAKLDKTSASRKESQNL